MQKRSRKNSVGGYKLSGSAEAHSPKCSGRANVMNAARKASAATSAILIIEASISVLFSVSMTRLRVFFPNDSGGVRQNRGAGAERGK